MRYLSHVASGAIAPPPNHARPPSSFEQATIVIVDSARMVTADRISRSGSRRSGANSWISEL